MAVVCGSSLPVPLPFAEPFVVVMLPLIMLLGLLLLFPPPVDPFGLEGWKKKLLIVNWLDKFLACMIIWVCGWPKLLVRVAFPVALLTMLELVFELISV